MKKNDIFLVTGILVVAAVLFAIVMFHRSKEDPDWVVVYVNGVETERYPLHTDAEYDIKEADGNKNHLSIKDGQAKITDANCADKICVHQAPASRNGDMIVCLPHEVMVMVESKEKAKTDSVVN